MSVSAIHRRFRMLVYVTLMTVLTLAFLMWFSFETTASPVLRIVLPAIIRAQSADAAPAAQVSSPFVYSFNASGTLYEAGSMNDSSSPYFWLNSGAKLSITNGIGRTVQGALAASDSWRLLYSVMNPLDTTNGYTPQNTLRLVTRSSWDNAQTSLQFRITKTNLTDTPNRDGYSGIFLMGRYANADNLYYAGIRHDGTAVIKKKINGTYYTLAQVQIFGKAGEYDRYANPNLLPQSAWLGIRMRTTTQSDGSVKIQLLLDRDNNGTWISILSAVDTSTGGQPLKNSGSVGIRTDFMDVEFDNFIAEKI